MKEKTLSIVVPHTKNGKPHIIVCCLSKMGDHGRRWNSVGFPSCCPHREAFFAKRQIYKKPFESGALSEVPVVGDFQIQFFFSREFLGPAKMVGSKEFVFFACICIYVYDYIITYVYICTYIYIFKGYRPCRRPQIGSLKPMAAFVAETH